MGNEVGDAKKYDEVIAMFLRAHSGDLNLWLIAHNIFAIDPVTAGEVSQVSTAIIQHAQARASSPSPLSAMICECGHSKTHHLSCEDHDECQKCQGDDDPCSDFRLVATVAITAEQSGMDSAWPLRDILNTLIKWADHLRNSHNCDCHGYEELLAAIDAAKPYMSLMTVTPLAGEASDARNLYGVGGELYTFVHQMRNDLMSDPKRQGMLKRAQELIEKIHLHDSEVEAIARRITEECKAELIAEAAAPSSSIQSTARKVAEKIASAIDIFEVPEWSGDMVDQVAAIVSAELAVTPTNRHRFIQPGPTRCCDNPESDPVHIPWPTSR